MKRFAAFLIFCATFVAFAPARALESPQKAVSIEGVTEYRLSNGLRILTLPDPAIDTVTVHITYFVGSRHEGYGEKGMAHLLEHMLFKGSKNFAEIKPALVKRGARYNGTTSNDRTNYFETLTASEDNLDWALSLEADRMVNSFVRKSDLDSEMTVVRNEFEMGENNAGSVLSQRMLRLAFPFHNYGNPVIGVRSDIEQVPIDRLQAFYRLWYQPDNALLIIAGRFDEKKALGMVARHFAGIPAPKRALPHFYTAEATQDGERSVILRRTGDEQIVAAMYRIPSAGHPDYPAIDILSHALGSTPSGRLHRALVQKGVASSTFGYERMMHDPGFATFGAVVAKDGDLAPARTALLAVTEGPKREPIVASEVERARTALLNDMEKAQLDSSGMVRWLSEFAAMGDWRLFYLYRDRLRKVTVADVQRVFDTYLKPANRVLGMFEPTDLPDRAEIPPPPDLSAALATYHGSDALAAGEAFDPSPANIEKRLIRKSLANGMSVALLPKKTRGANINLSLSLYWGDESSKEKRATACALASGMLMRGTTKHTRAELRDAFEHLSANVSVGAGGASVEVRRPQLDETLKLVAEVLREPSFPAAEFDELKRAMLVGAEGRRGDPSAIADEQLTRYLNPYPRGHWNYPLTTEETMAALKNTTLDEARSCYTDLVGATGAQIVAIGDFEPEALMREIEQLFGSWRSPAPYKRIPSRFFPRDPLERTVLTPDKANAVLRGGLNIELRDDSPDFPALVLGSYLLGGSSSARLPMRVREKEGLSYSTYAYFTAGSLDATALFGISSIYAPQNRDRVEKAIREELERALAKGFTDAEVEEGKKSLLQARRLARAQDRSLMGRLSNYLYIGRTFAWDIEFEKRIAALTPAEVRDALRKYVDVAKISVLKAGDFR